MLLRGALLCAALLTSAPLGAEILSARYTEPTTRYAHGVLGDAIEYGALELVTRAGRQITLRLPQARVFEDIAPRLHDLDHDGDLEVVVVESDQSRGARLAIYDESGLVDATPYIGQANRWLAPLGVADLDGDGAVELAYIDRPHLAKTLRIWRFQDGRLTHLADQPGLTNHRIGEDFISGGIRSCGDTPELITADASWTSIIATRFKGGRFTMRRIGAFDGPVSLSTALACP